MFKNYLKIVTRIFRKQKAYAFTNITGLTLAFVCSLLILFHVKEELSYEQNFPKASQIYRVTINSKYGDTYTHWAVGPPPLGPAMQSEIPEIAQTVRFRRMNDMVLSYSSSDQTVKRLDENGGFFVDPAAVDLFDLPFIKGNPKNALDENNAVLLTASMAKRYFGVEDPIGKALVEDGTGRLYQVTGVITDMPSSTHLQFDYLVSMSTFYQMLNAQGASGMLESRTWKAVYTYALIDDRHDKNDVETKLADFRVRSFHRDLPDREETFLLQPIRDIHLHSRLEQEMGPNSDVGYVYIFSIAALLILVVAAVNFVNLTTAQALKRSKEVGVRKVLGAQKQQLVKQFLGESFLLTFLAGSIALLVFYFSLPFFNNLSGKEYYFGQIMSADNVLLLAFVVIVTGLAAGLYPAIFVSGFRPALSLKGVKDPRSNITLVRKGLVIFQFAVSVFMIFSTITIYRQLVFLQEKDLGFQKEKLIAVQLYGDLYRNVVNNLEAMRTELLNYSAISHVSLTSNLPGERFSVEHLVPEGVSDDEDLPTVRVIRVDDHFIETLGIELKEGQNFRRNAGEERQYVLSELAVQSLDIQNPVGKKAQGYTGTGDIIGVFRDFHFASLHNVIEPLVLEYRSNGANYVLVRFQGENTSDVLQYVEQTLDNIARDQLFLYSFVDDNLNQLYVFENRLGDVFEVFSVIAILIACLGLFGLSVYSAELKVKEIGIRRVFGASVLGLSALLSRSFLTWVLVANVVAWPVAYIVMNRWLEHFAYRLNVGAGTFVQTAVLSIVIALLTVSYQSIKAALADPVDSLRYE